MVKGRGGSEKGEGGQGIPRLLNRANGDVLKPAGRRGGDSPRAVAPPPLPLGLQVAGLAAYSLSVVPTPRLPSGSESSGLSGKDAGAQAIRRISGKERVEPRHWKKPRS